MTDVLAPPEPEPEPPSPGGGGARKALIAVAIALLVIIGVKVVFVRWWRRGGARRAITGVAEDGAVKLADALIDQVLPAA